MNNKLTNEEKSKKNSPRRTRHSRNSPNSKLLNAAWPKAPSVPTKQSHIKAVDHSEFRQSWSEWKNQQVSNTQSGECSIEDMEIDDDVSMRSASTKKKQVVTDEIPESSGQSGRHTLRGSRRNIKDKKIVESSPNRSNIEVCEATSTSDTDKKLTPGKQKDPALFIIIHVNKVEVGNMKGPASSPVKVFADKFMVQMENGETKKDLSFRVPCRSISSLEISLLEKPYWIKFITSNINYVSNGPPKNRRSKGPPVEETVILHLGYEGSVPRNIRNDLQELFQVRLAELNLWPNDDAGVKSLQTQHSLEEGKSEEVQTSENEATTSRPKQRTSKGESASKPCTEKTTSSIVSQESPDQVIRKTRQATNKQPVTSASVQSIVRKRTPAHQKSVTAEEKEVPSDNSQVKVAKRSHHELTDTLEERVKTLSHEAAHYQMLSAQQRMIMQSLEEEIRRNTRNYESQLEMMREELANKQSQLDGSRETFIDHVDSNDAILLREELNSLRNELDSRDSLIRARNEELDTREETIRQLRNDIAKPKSSCRVCASKKNNEANEKTVPMSVMEETRQNLMQLQVSKEHLSMELERVRADLTNSKQNVDALVAQLENKENQIDRKTREIEALSASLRAAQVDLANSSRSVESLTRQVVELGENQQTNRSLAEELNTLRGRLGDAHVEIDELKTQVAEFEQALKKPIEENVASDWIVERGEVKLSDEVVGVGAWGNVKVGAFRGTRVAVKQIHLLILSPHNRRLFEREMAIASRCRHPCLVQFIGATNDDGTPLFVMELLESNLRTLLSRQALEDFDCIQIGFDVIRAISYLHLSKPVPIIHRDISSSNVLLYRGQYGWRGKLSDYGAANFVRISMTRHPGGLLYSAPEASTIDQTPKLDVYSFGVLFCEMCTRELPLPEKRTEQVRNVSHPERRTLINNCLRRNIDKRWDSLAVCKQIEEWNSDLMKEKD